MKKLLLLFLFSLPLVLAQTSKQSESLPMTKKMIDEKLDYINDNYDSIDLKQQEILLLRLKKESEKLDYDTGILESGNSLMVVYDAQNRNKDIIELGNQLKKIARNQKKDSDGHISNIYRRSARALSYLGLDDASKKDTETAIIYIKTINDIDRKQLRLTQCYMDMFAYYNDRKNSQPNNKIYKDSTVYYLEAALKEGKSIRDDGIISKSSKYNQLYNIHMRLGIFYLEYADTKGNLELAEKNLLKAQEFYDSKDYNISPELGKTILLNQLSWLYMEKKDYKKSIDFANRSLELEKVYKRPTARVKSFEFLATCYTELGEKEKSKFYLQKYTILKDSINIANRADADTVMKGMVKDVDNNHQESLKKPLILIWILIVIIVILFLLRRKNKTIYKKYEETIVKIKTENEQKDFLIEDQVDILKAKSSFNITDETTKKLLQKLKKFETSDRYLRKEISLTWLANSLHTNPRYLSEIIKIYKNKNFTSYINGLRISYIIKKLYGIPIYRDYKISYLAEECGYLTPRVFLTAFKNETGFTPSHFVQLLKDK